MSAYIIKKSKDMLRKINIHIAIIWVLNIARDVDRVMIFISNPINIEGFS